MNGRRLFLCLTIILAHSTLISANTDLADVQALQDLYRALNSSSQLQGWRSDGGDPCEESWKGVSCNGSSVITIKIPNLNLTGYLGFQLSNLHNLKELDVSSNKIKGEIPYGLPPNITHLNLACNNFSQSIPYSLSCLKNLQHVNVSHNSLSGSIGNIFTSLTDLREMDLSYNNFTGALPTSFLSLTNLTKLFLQSNEFTGSVVFLIGLPLSDLNIQDNCFSGVLPYQFQSIHNLWIGGNRFDKGINYPSWDFPLENIPNEQNTSITSPPSTESSAIESYPSSHKEGEKKKKEMGPGGIAFMIGGGTLVVFCAALVIVIHIHRSRALKLKRLESSEASRYSLPISTAREISSTPPEASPALSAIHTPPQSAPMHLPPIRVRTLGVSRRRSFSMKNRMPVGVKLYTVAELQLATNFFSEHNLLGEGSLGSVYKAEFPDGKISVVKNIDMVPLSMREEDQIMDVIQNASRLRHLNIVKLIGYCAEHGQHLLVYEYVRNLSLADALHCEAFVPLSWGLRVRIALGIARALNYLHSTCLPPVAHSNLKAANILLDEDLMPRICDCGLAVLKPLTSNTVKLRASEMAICDRGYIAPDHIQLGIDNCTKGDIYAFGVLLLELLSGRKPFDRTKPREEQYLVKWASSQLHVNESLEQMVDPAIKKTISSKALSRFADIVSLCIQPEKEFRPPMSEIVESLVFLLQQNRIGRRVSAEGPEVDPLNRSFRSTDTQFFCSPTVSYVSI